MKIYSIFYTDNDITLSMQCIIVVILSLAYNNKRYRGSIADGEKETIFISYSAEPEALERNTIIL